MRENKIEKLFCDLANKNGYMQTKLTTAGWPDRLLITDKMQLFIELKSTNGKLRPNQEIRFKQIFNLTGRPVIVLSSLKQVHNLFETLKKPARLI